MSLPTPRKSAASHFYKYRGSNPLQLEWLKDTLLKHEIYLPNRAELNDDNDGLPHLRILTGEEMATFLVDKFKQTHPLMSAAELWSHEEIIRYNIRLHGPAAFHPTLVQLMDAELKDYRVYSMSKRFDMGNMWALYADGHQGCCLEFQNVGQFFEHAKDVSYLPLKDMELLISDPSILHGHFFFCKTPEWTCEEEVRIVLSRIDGRRKALLDPTWLTRIILGKAMSEKNKKLIRSWATQRVPELTVVTTYYDAPSRSIKLQEE